MHDFRRFLKTKVNFKSPTPKKGSKSRLNVNPIEIKEKPKIEDIDDVVASPTKVEYSQELHDLGEFAKCLNDEATTKALDAFQVEAKRTRFQDDHDRKADVNLIAKTLPHFIETKDVGALKLIIQTYASIEPHVSKKTKTFYHFLGLAISEVFCREMVRICEKEDLRVYVAEHMLTNMIDKMRAGKSERPITKPEYKASSMTSVIFSLMSLQFKADASGDLHSFKEIFNRIVHSGKEQPEFWNELVQQFVKFLGREQDQKKYLAMANDYWHQGTNIFANETYGKIYTGDSESIVEVKALLTAWSDSSFEKVDCLEQIVQKMAAFSDDDPGVRLLKESLGEEICDYIVNSANEKHQQVADQVQALDNATPGAAMLKAIVANEMIQRMTTLDITTSHHGLYTFLHILSEMPFNGLDSDKARAAELDRLFGLVVPFAQNYLLHEKETVESIHVQTVTHLQTCYQANPEFWKTVITDYAAVIDFGNVAQLKSDYALLFVETIEDLKEHVIEAPAPVPALVEEVPVDDADSIEDSEAPLLPKEGQAQEIDMEGTYQNALRNFANQDLWRKALEQMKAAYDLRKGKDLTDIDFEKHMQCLYDAKSIVEGKYYENKDEVIAQFFVMRDFYNKGASTALKAVGVILTVLCAAMLVAGIALLAYSLSPAVAAQVPTQVVNAATSIVPADQLLKAGIALASIGVVGGVASGFFAYSKSTTAAASTMDTLAHDHAATLHRPIAVK